MSTPRPDDLRECTTCRAPVGSAQRYCLACGARQPGGPVDADDLSWGATVESVAVPGPPAAAAPQGPDGGRRSTLGFVSVVLLALLIGLLGGRLLTDGDDDERTTTQVVRVEGLPAGVAAGTPVASDAAAADEDDSAAAKKRKKAAEDEAEAKRKAAEVPPKKVTRKVVQKTFDDASGNENLAPEDSDPNGANFDEIK